jgi:hypothetical protein
MRAEDIPLQLPGISGKGSVLIRELPGIDEVDIGAYMLPPNQPVGLTREMKQSRADDRPDVMPASCRASGRSSRATPVTVA